MGFLRKIFSKKNDEPTHIEKNRSTKQIMTEIYSGKKEITSMPMPASAFSSKIRENTAWMRILRLSPEEASSSWQQLPFVFSSKIRENKAWMRILRLSPVWQLIFYWVILLTINFLSSIVRAFLSFSFCFFCSSNYSFFFCSFSLRKFRSINFWPLQFLPNEPGNSLLRLC